LIQTQHLVRAVMVALAVLIALHSRAARAVDPFEIEVYDGTANEPGAPGLELHANYVASGLRQAVLPELPVNHQTHVTLEPSLGLLPWWELGGYLESTVLGDGTFEYAGVKLRSKFVTPPSFGDRVRFGVNLEISLLPEHYDRNRWGMEVRPIAAYEDRRWLFAFNPIVDSALAGPDAHAGPSFEPAAMAALKLFEAVSVGVEYYGNLGPFSGFAPWRQQEHYLFEVANMLSLPHVEINAGIGEGLTANSNSLVVKMIVGYTCGR
jgi:hypothetical protein